MKNGRFLFSGFNVFSLASSPKTTGQNKLKHTEYIKWYIKQKFVLENLQNRRIRNNLKKHNIVFYI